MSERPYHDPRFKTPEERTRYRAHLAIHRLSPANAVGCDLDDELDRLIEAGAGNTARAKELRESAKLAEKHIAAGASTDRMGTERSAHKPAVPDRE